MITIKLPFLPTLKQCIKLRVSRGDADSQRLFWLADSDTDGEHDRYYMLVHILAVNHASCWAIYAIRRTATDHGTNLTKQMWKVS